MVVFPALRSLLARLVGAVQHSEFAHLCVLLPVLMMLQVVIIVHVARLSVLLTEGLIVYDGVGPFTPSPH